MIAASRAHRLFVASCISLVTTSMVFATRGAITGPMTEQFHISNEQIGLVYGASFWVSPSPSSSAACWWTWWACGCARAVEPRYLAGLALVLLAPRPGLEPGATVEGIFSHGGTTMLYAGFLAMGLSQGLVEG